MKTSISTDPELRAEFIHCHRLRQRIVEMMEKDIKSIHKSMGDLENFEVPNWALLQAQKIAEVRTKEKLIQLLSN